MTEEKEEKRIDALDYVSGIQDFIDLHAKADDNELQNAIGIAMKCIAKPDMPHAAAKRAMVQLQGYAFKFKMQALVYMQIHTGKTGSDENIKKNAYMYASEQCDKLAQTLKYLVRETI